MKDYDEMIARAEMWAEEQLKNNPLIKALMEEDNAKLQSEGRGQLDQDSGAGPVRRGPEELSPLDGGQ